MIEIDDSYEKQTFFRRLDGEGQVFVRDLARKYRLTFQNFRFVCEAAVDLAMWNETPLPKWWKAEEKAFPIADRVSKKELLKKLERRMQELRRRAKSYPAEGLARRSRLPLARASASTDKTVFGMCPVASEETVCCNLRTIDAVENCGFGCSYCAVETFYDDQVVFDAQLGEKLALLGLDPERFYHIGTGQSSDSLMWGNQQGLLDALSGFARERPNVLLELKTKSKNIDYFLENQPSKNIVLSWSLNTPTIIENEEHFTASLDERLSAARRVADLGIKIAFHFHPIVHYQSWRDDYTAVAKDVIDTFSTEEVLFLSFGTVTFIKPIVKAIRARGGESKILQMEMTPAPKGKLSYPDAVKRELFEAMADAFSPWRGKVFTYLCMEKAELWESTFGFAYRTNEEFEEAFGRDVMAKIGREHRSR